MVLLGYGASGGASDQLPGHSAPLPRGDAVTHLAATDPRSRLSSGTFDQRQRAMWELWRDRAANREAVRGAAGDPDPEVASRAQWILDRWRRGILPETPTDLARRLEVVSHADSLQRLLDAGLFHGARVVIEEAVQVGDRATLDRAAAIVQRGFPFYVRAAAEQGQLAEFAGLVDPLATTAPMIICRNRLRDLLGGSSDGPATPQAAAPDPRRPPDWEQQRAAVIALAAAGQLEAATQLAQKAGVPELLRVCQVLARDWTALGQTQLHAAQQAAATSQPSERHWAYVLIAAARSGDAALREQAVAALSLRPEEPVADAADDPLVRLRWQVLAMHGEIDAAVQLAAATQPLLAAELLAQAGRLEEALALIELSPQEIDSRLGEWITAARLAEEEDVAGASRASEAPEPLRRLITAGRLLVQAGRRDAAWDLFASLAAAPANEEAANFSLSRALVMQALLRLNRTDWLIRIAMQSPTKGLSATDRHFLARALNVQPETLDALRVATGQLLPGDERQAAQAALDLLRGELPANFDPKRDHQRLFDLLSMASPQVVRRSHRIDPPRPTAMLNLEIAKLFEAHGQVELAKKSLLQLAARGDLEAAFELAQVELKAGQVQVARSLYETLWQRIDQQRRDPQRLHLAHDDSLAAMQASVGEAVAAARMGDRERAEQLWWQIELMACTPAAKLQDAFGAYLLEEGYDERALRIYQTLGPWMAFGSDEGLEFYTVARNHNRAIPASHPRQAAQGFDLAIVGTLESTMFYPAAYISLPAYVHRQHVLAAIQDKQPDRAEHHIAEVMRLNPIDIEFGEKIVPQLRSGGLAELADETIEQIYQAGRRHLEAFPLDLVTANNLAWILALADHRLDAALELSRRAVYFSPESTVYRDTLAEVLFRLNRGDEAIAIEQACLLDDPGQWHLHEQLRRFETPPRR